jgi:hypothetical protein
VLREDGDEEMELLVEPTLAPPGASLHADPVAPDAVPVSGATVVVCWTGYRAGPWAIRSLERGGYRVVGAHDAGRPMAGRLRECPRPLRYPPPNVDLDGFASAMADFCAREGAVAVLPVSEDVTRALAQIGDRLPGVVVVGPNAQQYQSLCDKAELAAVCARVGVDHPAQVAVDTEGVPEGPWPALPSIVKPSLSSENLGDVPAAERVDTAAARTRVLERFARAGLGAVVQEFIEGQAWVTHCVRGDAGLGLVAARVAGTWPPRVGTSSVSRPVAPPEPLLHAGRAILDAVDYRGPACMNLIERGGRFFLHDVNLRLPASVGAAVGAGLDLPRLGVEAALGLTVGVALPEPNDVLYVRTDGEIARAVSQLRAGNVGRAGAIAREIARAGFSPKAILDPSPLDPFWLGAVACDGTMRTIRRARRRLFGGRG